MILVLRALGVGDLATAVPALRGLRTAFPDQPLALAAPAWLAPLVELIGGIEHLVPTDGLDPDVPLPTAATAVNLHGCGPESHRLLRAAGPGRLWAFSNVEAGHLHGPSWVDEEHEVHRWCRLVGHYGVPTDETDLALAVPAVPVPTGVTIIHPGAKSPTRRWPPARFATVARHLTAAGHRILVTGSTDERDLALHVASAAGLDTAAAPTTGLVELAGLVARARLVISGDTGVAHLATAYQTPSVTLFGPMSPARWGPPDRPYHRALWYGTRSEPGNLTGSVHPALLAVGEPDVLAAARQVTLG